jgi:hydroxymethylpyrimidine pyrophosphatase-like HAD family hydrolase
MWFHVLACDYDRTTAFAGTILPETFEALARVRESGRRVLLVTGRELDNLLEVCPEIDRFDLVVAENGAVLYDPRAKKAEVLVEPPPPSFVAALRDRAVPASVGRCIVSSVVPHEGTILETIHALGLELQIVFNVEAVMVLPTGVSKASGLLHALRRLGISRHNVVAVGDAENDHAFLGSAGFAVAVANAVPSLAAEADWVTAQPAGAGVRELCDRLVEDDLGPLRKRLMGRQVVLGVRPDGSPFSFPVFGPNLLITGTSGTGKSTLAGVFVERLVRDDYVICLLDPEGDFRSLAEQEGIVVLSSEEGDKQADARADEVAQLVKHRGTSVVIDLSQLAKDEKVRAAGHFLRAVQRLRGETGAPHWLIVDEAHHLFPPGGSVAQDTLPSGTTGLCLITNEPQLVDGGMLSLAHHVFSTATAAITDVLPLVKQEHIPGAELATGEALSVALDAGGQVERFTVAKRETHHRRHVKKYSTGKLPLDRAFHFTGPRAELDLIAQNLETFTMLARGVDDATWLHHLTKGDMADWFEREIKDPDLAAEVRTVAANGADAAGSRRAVLEAIGRRYTPVTPPKDA